MNHRILSFLIAAAATSILWLACQKEVDQFLPDDLPSSFDFSSRFTAADDTSVFTIDGQLDQLITTPAGRQFAFHPDIFEYDNGSSCSCESVQILIIELKIKRDYIVHQKPTVSHDRLLISAGAFHISAFHQGKALRLKPDKVLPFSIPSTNPDPDMELFYGNDATATFNWDEADQQPGSSSAVVVVERQTDSSFFVGYDCFTDRLAWINVDKLVDESVKNPVCLSVDTLSTHLNTVVFAVLVDQLAILNLYPTDDRKYCIAHLPVGAQVIFLAIRQLTENEYEFAISETEIGSDHHQSLLFESKTLLQIKAVLQGL
ncbi:MAG: hypothetical protein OEQ53_03035 [Saprospiraceae bacterium]|nr:hypothetical protein [Saprospiraceae bacterium]